MVQAVFNGASIIMLVEIAGGATLKAEVNPRSDMAGLKPGDQVALGWAAADAHSFPRAAA